MYNYKIIEGKIEIEKESALLASKKRYNKKGNELDSNGAKKDVYLRKKRRKNYDKSRNYWFNRICRE